MAKNNNGKRPYRDDVREFERRPQDERQRDYIDDDRLEKPAAEDMYRIRLKKYRKKPVYIEDMNGKAYIINGNFTVEFVLEMAKYVDEVKRLESDLTNIENVTRLYEVYKEWCLKLINYNVDGEQYTMKDVVNGFSDLEAMKYLMGHIAKLIARAEKEMNSNENR